MRTGTGNATTRVLGLAALAMTALVVVLGLVVTPPDQVQGQLVRLIYVHPAVAMVCYVSFGITAPQMARGQYWIHPALPEVIENALLALGA